MDAIKKKMLAMKMEKENAVDRAEQNEQKLRDTEEQKAKVRPPFWHQRTVTLSSVWSGPRLAKTRFLKVSAKLRLFAIEKHAYSARLNTEQYETYPKL